MAVLNVSSRTKTEVYESLHLISQATQQITDQLERLRLAKALAPVFADIQKLAAYELRAVIATSAVHNLATPELEDASRHEHARIRMETRLERSKPKMPKTRQE